LRFEEIVPAEDEKGYFRNEGCGRLGRIMNTPEKAS